MRGRAMTRGPSTAKRRASERRGRRAETLVAWWLRLQGWQILDRRARTGAGEIDLVARRGRVLAFIEVKNRKDFEQARLALSPRQQGRLLRAGGLWRARNRRYQALQPRFDLVVAVPWRLPHRIAGAFQAEGRDALTLI